MLHSTVIDVQKCFESIGIDSVASRTQMVFKNALKVIGTNLISSLKLEGDVVECGCHKGVTTLFLKKILDYFNVEKDIHVYDSFEGLPQPTEKEIASSPEIVKKEGGCRASVEDFRMVWRGYPLPHIHKGWFEQTLPDQLPEKICFAFLDGDFYESILISLIHVWPRIIKGGTILIHDYCNSSLPGVKIACDEFFLHRQCHKEVISSMLCVKKMPPKSSLMEQARKPPTSITNEGSPSKDDDIVHGECETVQCDVVVTYHPDTLQWVCTAIDSILNQNNACCNIYVIADAVSKEDANNIQSKYGHLECLQFYRNETSIGPYLSLHKVFCDMKGDYIAIQDSDDIALPNRIWHSITALKRAGAEIFGGAAEQFVDCGSRSDVYLMRMLKNYPIMHSGDINRYYPNGRVLNPTMVLKRETFECLNGFTDWLCGCDAEFTERARQAGASIFISDEVVLLRRLHSKSLCNGEQYGMQSQYREQIITTMLERFKEFVPGFDPRRYGCLDSYRKQAGNSFARPSTPKEIVLPEKSVSACLLSWKRPENMQRIVDHLRSFPFIDDILIWNNNADVKLDLRGEDVRIISSMSNKGTYGRYICAQNARHNTIYTQDDDCITQNVPEAYRTFLLDPKCIAHSLQPMHFEYNSYNIFETAQMSFVGWGAFFKKNWIEVFDTYIHKFGEDDLLFNEADRIFSLLLNRRHNSILTEVEHLSGVNSQEAMWKRPDHWDCVERVMARCLSLLGIEVAEGTPLSIHSAIAKEDRLCSPAKM